jgi:cyclomaltodextrinase
MLGAVLLVAGGVFANEVPVAFGTHGGDAWSFHQQVEIAVPARRCDHVVVSSPMATVSLRAARGHVRARLALQPGNNQIRAECRERGVVRGKARQNWQVRLRNAPMASIRLHESGAGLILDAHQSAPAPVYPAAIIRYEWRAGDGGATTLAGLPASGPRLALSRPAPDGEYKVTLDVTDAAGRSDRSTILLRSQDQVLRGVDPAHDHAAWIDRAVVYGIVPKLFGSRGLADVTARLDQLADLGVTALWLSPLMESPPGDFGYAVTDYFRLRPSLGSEAEFRDLIQAAHARGMRVILDFVPNHLSDRSAYFTDTVAHGRASPYFDLFSRDRGGHAEHYFDWVNLENLNYANPQVQRLVVEGFAYWVREYDVDGFRVDAAWGPRQRAPEFWPRWRAALKRIKPDLLLLAEASARDRYYGRHGFDAAYDWTDKLGEWAWQKPFDDEANTAQGLRSAIEKSSSEALVSRFLENNDTGPRFRSRYGLERTRIAAAMLLTLPGIPCLYTGEEIGAAYEPYKDAKPIVWDDVDGLRGWYKRLITLRRDFPALRSRNIRLLDVAPEQNVLAYVRPAVKPSDSILVILNYGTQPAVVALGNDAAATQGRTFVDLLNGEEVRPEGSGIAIAARSVRILKAG